MRARRASGAVALAAVLSGCADRGLVSEPHARHGAGTWLAVAVAATAATFVIAALVLALGRGVTGSPLAAGVLALQVGAVVVSGAVLAGAGVRGEQLLDRPPDGEHAASLLRLSGLDGRDVGFFRVVTGFTLVLALLLGVVLVLAARFAAGTDRFERGVATGVLVVQSGGAGAALGLVVLGHHSLPFVLPAALLPLLVLAAIGCWPSPPAEPAAVGYNDPHG